MYTSYDVIRCTPLIASHCIQKHFLPNSALQRSMGKASLRKYEILSLLDVAVGDEEYVLDGNQDSHPKLSKNPLTPHQHDKKLLLPSPLHCLFFNLISLKATAQCNVLFIFLASLTIVCSQETYGKRRSRISCGCYSPTKL